MRAIGKGRVSFGLVSIPVSLDPGSWRAELKFYLLRGPDSSWVDFKRVAESLEREFPESVVFKMQKNLHGGKIFVNWRQNNAHQNHDLLFISRKRTSNCFHAGDME